MQDSKKSKLFVVIQPLQYLQAVELFDENEYRVLIVPWANEENQLHSLVDPTDWDKILWVEYSGTALDVIKHRSELKKLLKTIGAFEEVIISAYYNELMNVFANSQRQAKITLLEDGNATLHIDSSTHYKTIKYYCKYFACKCFGFNIEPIKRATLFMLERKSPMKWPRIAADVKINTFKRLRAQVENYESNNSIYFVSSAFINAGMMSQSLYIEFLRAVAKKYNNHDLKIILHRFDKESDFIELNNIPNVEVLVSKGPIELLFKNIGEKPFKLISAGSAATETLSLIYDIDTSVVMPKISKFGIDHQADVQLMVEHLQKSHTVEFL